MRFETSFSKDITWFEHHSSSVWHCDLDFSIFDEIYAVSQIPQMEDNCLLLESSLMHMRGQGFLLRSGQPSEDRSSIDVVKDDAMTIIGQFFHLPLQILLAEGNQLAL